MEIEEFADQAYAWQAYLATEAVVINFTAIYTSIFSLGPTRTFEALSLAGGTLYQEYPAPGAHYHHFHEGFHEDIDVHKCCYSSPFSKLFNRKFHW